MILAVSRFTVSQRQARELEARFIVRPRLVDAHDGFRGLEVLKSGAERVTFMLITRWDSREQLKAYLQSEDFIRVHKGSAEEAAEFRIYELVGE
jgi:heme oxygenase (mycobilin-producing)